MKTVTGRHRFVVLLPMLGVVIKMPRLRIYMLRFAFDGKDSKMFTKDRQFKKQAIAGFCKTIRDGIGDNWREFVYYIQTRDTFAVPTFFSFLGLLNVQRFREPTTLDMGNLWRQLRSFADAELDEDSHTFSDPRNFTLATGRLQILDYGSQETQVLIKKFGKSIWVHFDPSYVHQETTQH